MVRLVARLEALSHLSFSSLHPLLRWRELWQLPPRTGGLRQEAGHWVLGAEGCESFRVGFVEASDTLSCWRGWWASKDS